MLRKSLIAILLNYAGQLRFKNLFLLLIGLFLLDLVIPDIIPFADEILLAILALLISRWKID